MFKDFLLRKILRKQGVPEPTIDIFLRMMAKDPELFKTIAKETKEKMDQGMDQASASMAVMKKHENELKNLAQ